MHTVAAVKVHHVREWDLHVDPCAVQLWLLYLPRRAIRSLQHTSKEKEANIRSGGIKLREVATAHGRALQENLKNGEVVVPGAKLQSEKCGSGIKGWNNTQ